MKNILFWFAILITATVVAVSFFNNIIIIVGIVAIVVLATLYGIYRVNSKSMPKLQIKLYVHYRMVGTSHADALLMIAKSRSRNIENKYNGIIQAYAKWKNKHESRILDMADDFPMKHVLIRSFMEQEYRRELTWLICSILIVENNLSFENDFQLIDDYSCKIRLMVDQVFGKYPVLANKVQ